ncbi:head maturation protease, ClpP-related [Bacillus thuringiensis]|uniref:head maturation protease, ClpP-related n=1 Tax=Bacillus tropicus TaxID=2026188 RepID=UPI0035E27685
MHGVVGKEPFGEISSKGVREALDDVEANEIELHIHSNGGDAFEGIAICNYLRNHKAKITAIIDGMAASAASLIAMGADKIVMPNNTVMMVHRAATFAYGNAVSMEKQAKMLRDVDKALIQTYKNRFKGRFSELEKLLDDETYMTAEQAKKYGFCDVITEDVQKPKEVNNVRNIRSRNNKRSVENRNRNHASKFLQSFAASIEKQMTQKRGL